MIVFVFYITLSDPETPIQSIVPPRCYLPLQPITFGPLSGMKSLVLLAALAVDAEAGHYIDGAEIEDEGFFIVTTAMMTENMASGIGAVRRTASTTQRCSRTPFIDSEFVREAPSVLYRTGTASLQT
jgi:hypothetical protein